VSALQTIANGRWTGKYDMVDGHCEPRVETFVSA